MNVNIKKILLNKSGIFPKFFITLLFLSIVPLLIIGIITSYSLKTVQKTITDDSAQLINKNIEKNLLIQASDIAGELETFLRLNESNLFELAQTETTNEKYLNFVNNKKYEVWEQTSKNDSVGKRFFIPLYKEVSFVDVNGYEKVKIKDSKIVDKKLLKNVNNPGNASYLNNEYFTEGIKLNANEIYVSHLNGFFISIEEIEKSDQLKMYDGVIWFSTPLFRDNEKVGLISIALDHRHLMQFTQHVQPNSEKEILVSNYNSGDYAFLFDDEGWIITHPKLWDIRGIDNAGKLIPAYTSNTTMEMKIKGFIPFNLDSAGFIHPNYPEVAKNIRKQITGKVVTTNVGGIDKLMVYTPVLYNKGVYTKHGIFGGITLGTEIIKFHSASDEIKNAIESTFNFFIKNILIIIGVTLLLSLGISLLLTNNFTKPIIKLTNFSKNLTNGLLDERINLTRNDEIGILAKSFNTMANELEKGRNQLLDSYSELQSSKKEIENYSADLEYQLSILKSIQSISNIIGSTFDLNMVLKKILRTCVESVTYDRAILYLLDDEGKYLECKEMYGFTVNEEKVAKNSLHSLLHSDCIETKVVKSGKIIFVDDFSQYTEATELDKKIRNIAKSNSFVFVPLRVKEKIIGILGADKLRTGKGISETDINSLQILANQASRVIENTRLYTEILSQRNFVKDIISNMINGVISTNGKGIITSINKSAIDILEFTEIDLVGKNIWELLHNAESFMKKMKKNLTENGIYRVYAFQVEIKNKTKYLNINASRVYENNIHTGTIIILEDVSEKKKLDEELQKVDRLASLGKFSAGIAHEIRNPLTGLSLYLDNLHDQLMIENPSYSKLLSNALKEVERLDNLVNEILDYSFPGESKKKLNNINKVIESTISILFSQFEKAKIKVETCLQKETPQFIFDSEKIKQAFINIIVNSIHVMPNGGKLFIKTEFLNNEESKSIEITIADTGDGFINNDFSSIFEPFYSNKKEGIGLGLAITHSIILEHGGEIKALNGSNGGAEFIIKLPIIV